VIEITREWARPEKCRGGAVGHHGAIADNTQKSRQNFIPRERYRAVRLFFAFRPIRPFNPSPKA
jgi:hypothetical protein